MMVQLSYAFLAMTVAARIDVAAPLGPLDRGTAHAATGLSSHSDPGGAGTALRFWSKVLKRDGSGCWIWLGAMHRLGYGMFRVGTKTKLAHRVAYEMEVGPVPSGLQLDHLCRNRKCVKPTHLEAVTSRENLMRGQTLARKNASKTACKNGHPFDTLNTIARGESAQWRRCRICQRKVDRESKRRHRESNKTPGSAGGGSE